MKNILFLLFALALVTASCDQENEGELYDFQGVDHVAVGTANVNAPYGLNAENNYTIAFPLHRGNKDASETTAKLNLTADNLFELSSNMVTFEKGSAIAYAKIVAKDAGALDPAKAYEFKLAITGDNASKFNSSATFSANLELNWEDLGQANFVSEWMEDTYKVKFSKAKGLDIYRAVSLYEDGSDILFILDKANNTVSIPAQKAWYHSQGYQVLVKGDGTVSVNSAGKTEYTMTLNHYIHDVYDFGVYEEMLTLP